MKPVTVVYVDKLNDVLTSWRAAKIISREFIVLVKYSDNPRDLLAIKNEIQRFNIIRPKEFDIILVDNKSLIQTLASHGYRLSRYIGPYPELVSFTKAQREKKSQSKRVYKVLEVDTCSKCECRLGESGGKVSKKVFDLAVAAALENGTEHSLVDETITLFTSTSTCRAC